MKFGDFEIKSFVESNLRLDGGAMFGVVPKSIWSKLTPSDNDNRMPMCNNFFVINANGKNIILDCGLGDTLAQKETVIYGFDGNSNIVSGIESIGLKDEDIDYVILTHLHTDHMAGSVKKVDGEYVPRFPNAKIIASKLDYEAAMHPNERTAAIYKPERVEALKNAGVLELVEGNEELLPGFQAVFTGGHSAGHFGLDIESNGERVHFYSDLIPMSLHLPLPYVAALDIEPLVSLEAKRILLPKLLDPKATMLFVHDLNYPMAKVSQDGNNFTVSKIG